MEVVPPYVPENVIASPTTMDQERFVALERRVESLFLQMQQRDSTPPPSAKSDIKRAWNQSTIKEGSNFTKPNSLPLSPPVTPEASLPPTPALQSEDKVEIFEKPSTKLSLQILDIIQRYGHNVNSQNIPWAGKSKFLPFVEEFVKKNEAVRMVLPAFPFKSPNRKDKVLGSMPDLGEELALMHLNGLCDSITEIYEPGANITITSDGLVYNGELKQTSPERNRVSLS